MVVPSASQPGLRTPLASPHAAPRPGVVARARGGWPGDRRSRRSPRDGHPRRRRSHPLPRHAARGTTTDRRLLGAAGGSGDARARHRGAPPAFPDAGRPPRAAGRRRRCGSPRWPRASTTPSPRRPRPQSSRAARLARREGSPARRLRDALPSRTASSSTSSPTSSGGGDEQSTCARRSSACWRCSPRIRDARTAGGSSWTASGDPTTEGHADRRRPRALAPLEDRARAGAAHPPRHRPGLGYRLDGPAALTGP